MYLETSNGCFDIDPSLQAVAIANEKVLKLFEMRKFRQIKEYKMDSIVKEI
jgi:hypothetical protein